MKLILDSCFTEHAWSDHVFRDEGEHSKKKNV